MSPYYEHAGITLLHGHSASVLRDMEDESVHCCITSPPYWGLRDYGADDQIGMEATPEEYVAALLGVFSQVHRVLRPDGTLWLNLGDCYNNAPGQRKQGVERNDVAGWKQQTNAGCLTIGSRSVASLKPKDLVGIPWRVAFALQSQGWWLRSDIIWAKSNPMPESVTDRPTRSHEYLFLLAKSEKYYYDAAAIAEKSVCTDLKKFTDGGKDKQRGHSRRHAGFNGRYAESLAANGVPQTRNKRDVWNVNTQPFPEAHFAVFPPALIRPCVLAGCPVEGVVLDPFGGSGTTGLVAKEGNRRAVLIDVREEYLEIAAKRLSQEVMDFGAA